MEDNISVEDLLEMLEYDIGLSPAQIGRLLVGEVQRNYRSEDIIFEYLNKNMVCSECFGQLEVERSWENTDADGNRGNWESFLICRSCNDM